MRGIKIPPQEFALKMHGGGAYARGGAYLWDTTVHIFMYCHKQIDSMWFTQHLSHCAVSGGFSRASIEAAEIRKRTFTFREYYK